MTAAPPSERSPRRGARVRADDLKAAWGRFQADGMMDHAAALTYYVLMSLAPGLLVAAAILGVVGQAGLIADATDYLRQAGAPPETVDAVGSIIEGALAQQGTAVTSLVVGLLVALNGASGAFAAAGRALNVVWRVDEGRSFVSRKLTDVGWTLVLLALVLVTLVLVFLGGQVVDDLFGAIGLGATAAQVWRVARWPAALLTASAIYAVIFYAAPNVRAARIEWVSPGSVLGVCVWILASAGFFLYVANFSFGAAYGTLAGVVILLVWLWLTNSVMLFAAELNAAIDRRRAPGLPERYDGPSRPERVVPDEG